MSRVIVKLYTKEDVYEVGKSPLGGEFMVESIRFFRDGLRNINAGAPDPANYLVTSANPLNDKDKVFQMIPHKEVKKVMFVLVEKEKKEDTSEIPTEMTQE